MDNNNAPQEAISSSSETQPEQKQTAIGGDLNQVKATVGTLLDDAEKLKHEIERLAKESGENIKKVEKNEQLVFYGFIVLLVMVAGIVITSFQQMSSTYSNLLDKISILQIQLNSKHR